MSAVHKVVVITGASQGIGEGLVRGYLDRGYRVVANSRSIKLGSSADVFAVAGDIADPKVAERVVASAARSSAGSTRWSTMPAYLSPNRSPSTPGKTTTTC